MDTAERIYREAKTLPEAQAKEVLDFLEFLKSNLKRTSGADTKKQPMRMPCQALVCGQTGMICRIVLHTFVRSGHRGKIS